MRRKRRWRNLVYLVAGIAIGYLALCFYLAHRYVYPGTANSAGPPSKFTIAKDFDAWKNKDWKRAAPIYILVHGYGGTQEGWSDVAEELRRRGNNVVILALPGHDNRTSEPCGFGISESETVLKAVAWSRTHGDADSPIVLVGVSMGGAASWLAAAKSSEVAAVVTEGTFSKLEPATKRWFNRKFPAASVCLAPVFWFAQRLSGVDPANVNPIDSAVLWKGKPALVIHGELDQLFLPDEGRALAEASGAPLWMVTGATHAHCSDPDLAGYVDHLTSVLH